MVKWLVPTIPANGATRPNVNTPLPSLATGLMSQGNMVLAWTHYFLSTSHSLYYCPPRSSADPPSSQQELDADVRQQKLERGKPPTARARRKYCKVDHTSSIQNQKFKNLRIAFYIELLQSSAVLLWLALRASLTSRLHPDDGTHLSACHPGKKGGSSRCWNLMLLFILNCGCYYCSLGSQYSFRLVWLTAGSSRTTGTNSTLATYATTHSN